MSDDFMTPERRANRERHEALHSNAENMLAMLKRCQISLEESDGYYMGAAHGALACEVETLIKKIEV